MEIYKILSSKDQGNYIVASKDIKAGEFIVFRERPYSYCINYKIDENEKRICHYCLAISNYKEFGIKCESCKFNYYCSEKCKYEDYQLSHEYECSAFKKIQSASQFDKDCKTTIKLLIKILISQFKEIKMLQQNQSNELNNIQFNNIIGLESNLSKFSTQRITDFMKVSKFIEKSINKDILSTIYPNLKEYNNYQSNMIKLMCILECNTHDISFPFKLNNNQNNINNNNNNQYNYYSIGIGIYYKSSLFNHSCQPNICKVIETCDNNYASHSMIAIKDIKENEEISFNYIQLNLTKQERIEKLQSSYYFTCKCKSCISSNKIHKEFLNQFKCQKSNCSGLIFQYNNNNNNNSNNNNINNIDNNINNNNLLCNICLPIKFNNI